MRRLLKAQKMRVGALATLKANRQLGVPPEGGASASAPDPQARPPRPVAHCAFVVSSMASLIGPKAFHGNRPSRISLNS